MDDQVKNGGEGMIAVRLRLTASLHAILRCAPRTIGRVSIATVYTNDAIDCRKNGINISSVRI